MSIEDNVGMDVLNIPEQPSVMQNPEQKSPYKHRALVLGAAALVGASAALVPLAVATYRHDYIATDGCTDLYDQSVSVLNKWSPSGISAMMHGEFMPWQSGSTTLAAVVEEQQTAEHRNYGIDPKKVAAANGKTDLDMNAELAPGVYCYKGFGPEIATVQDEALVQNAPIEGFWQALDGVQGKNFTDLLSAVAVANGTEIYNTHSWPATGTYPLSRSFWTNIQNQPGITEEALARTQEQAKAAGLELK